MMMVTVALPIRWAGRWRGKFVGSGGMLWRLGSDRLGGGFGGCVVLCGSEFAGLKRGSGGDRSLGRPWWFGRWSLVWLVG